jgi:hypothetical protein
VPGEPDPRRQSGRPGDAGRGGDHRVDTVGADDDARRELSIADL